MDGEHSDYLSESLAFDEYVLDAELKELRGSQGRIDVQRKVLHVLFFLARNNDRVVSKEELLAGVWPGTVVTDAVLSQAVRKARSALGDDGRAQQLIRTVHGHGYRLEATVTAGTVRAPGSGPDDAPAATARLAPAFDPLEQTVVPGVDAHDVEAPDFGPPGGVRAPGAAAPARAPEAPPFEALPRQTSERETGKPAVPLLIGVGLLALGLVAAALLLG